MRATFVALVIPVALAAAVAAAPVPKAGPVPITEQQLTAARNNLTQIALALNIYSDANNSACADDIRNKDGKPLLSWRVAILPYIEEEELYKQFKLDEPWDSDNNKKLIEKVPQFYSPVRVKATAGETFYQRFTGDDALFASKGPRFKFATIPDGTSNTAVVVEAGSPVIWSMPADIPFDSKMPLPKLGGLFDGEFHVVLYDGRVMRVKKDFDEAEMRKLVMPDDGNEIDFKKLEK